jgi:hypothetical protein
MRRKEMSFVCIYREEEEKVELSVDVHACDSSNVFM